MKHQAAGLFEILDPDIGNALVKDWRSSWKYLTDLAESFVTKMFWSVINLAYPWSFCVQIRVVSEATLAHLWLNVKLVGRFWIGISLNCCKDINVSPAHVPNNHLLFIIGLEMISINGWASSLPNAPLISRTSLQANLMQVCCIMLTIDGFARMSSGGFALVYWWFWWHIAFGCLI
jgi:hypothetical protein